MVADSTQTLLCTYLSAVLLVGLVLNATLGWSWADPLAGLVIAAVAVKEGRQAWRGEGCCAPAAATPAGATDIAAGACSDTGCACCPAVSTDPGAEVDQATSVRISPADVTVVPGGGCGGAG